MQDGPKYLWIGHHIGWPGPRIGWPIFSTLMSCWSNRTSFYYTTQLNWVISPQFVLYFSLLCISWIILNGGILLGGSESSCFQTSLGQYLDSWSYYEWFFWPRRRIEGTKIHYLKKSKKTLPMAPSNLCCTIGTKIDTKAVLVTSLAKFPRLYGGNKKTRILVGTVLDVEIGPKATTLVRRRTFAVANFDLGGGDMKVATINIGFSIPTLRNLFVLLLMAMVGIDMLLTPQLLLF